MNNRPIQTKKKAVENLMTAGVVIVVFAALVIVTIFLVKNVLFQKDVNNLSVNFTSPLKPVAHSTRADTVLVKSTDTVYTSAINTQVNSSKDTVTQIESDSSAKPIHQSQLQQKIVKAVQTSQKISDKPITSVIPEIRQPFSQKKSKLFSEAVSLMSSGKLLDAISKFEAFRSENQQDQELLKKTAYYIACCQFKLYLSGSCSGGIVIKSWYNVQDVYKKGTSQFHEADSILSLFGANR